MLKRYLGDKSIVLGLILAAISIVVLFVTSDYAMGTARRMGPGYFPTLLAMMLAGFAIALLLRGIFGEHQPIESFAAAPAMLILAGAAFFALLLRHGGLPAAIILMVVVAGFASRYLSFMSSMMLAIGLAVGSTVVFVYLLGQPIPVVGDWLKG